MPAVSFSAMQNLDRPDVPTLAQMILDGQEAAKRIRRASQEALAEWFAQSQRLNVARSHYKLRGERFIQFARDIGIDKSSAYNLVKLHRHRAAITSRCLDEAEAAAKRSEPFQYPGWLTALSWFESIKHSDKPTWSHVHDDYESPEKLFEFLDKLFRFDVDVCATAETTKCDRFYTKEDNGLKQIWKPAERHWMNPPYSRAGEWAAKAANSAKDGAIVVGLLANRSATGWYRDHVIPSAAVIQLYGRMTFNRKQVEMSVAPFPSILAVWPKQVANRLSRYTRPITARLLALPE